DRTRRTSWKVQHHGCGAYSANAAAEHCKRSLFLPFTAHAFRNAVEHASTNSASCFRRDIAGGNSRPSGGHHQPRPARELDDCLHDCSVLIWDHSRLDDGEVMLLERLDDRRTREIVTFAARTRVAHRENRSAECLRNRGGRHLPPLFVHPGRASPHRAGASLPSGGPGCSEWWSAAWSCPQN